jgi:hypothetical protein
MEWIVTNQPYFKVKVTQDGVYRLNYADLQAAGLPVTQTNGNQYQVFHLGKEIPIYVSSGALPIKNNDYLEFVATKNRGEMDRFLFERPETDQLNPKYSLISDTAAYFLTIVPSGTPTLRYQDQVNDWNNLPNKITTYRKTAAYVFSEQFNHTRYDFENLVAYSSYDMGEGFGSAFAAAKDLDFTLENLNAGTYRVMFNLPTGYVVSTPNVGSNDEVDSDVNTNGMTGNITLPFGNDKSATLLKVCKHAQRRSGILKECAPAFRFLGPS